MDANTETMAKKQTAWLVDFEQSPPTEFPLTVEWQERKRGPQTGVFDTAEMFRAGVMYATSSLKRGQTDHINEQKTREAALAMLWQQLEIEDWFKKYAGRQHSISNLAEGRERFNQERAERLRNQRMATMQRLRRDIDDLSTRAEELLVDPDLPSADMLDLARFAGSIHTRLRQMGMAAERREWSRKEEDA